MTKRWNGYRLLAGDGSFLNLPKTDEKELLDSGEDELVTEINPTANSRKVLKQLGVSFHSFFLPLSGNRITIA